MTLTLDRPAPPVSPALQTAPAMEIPREGPYRVLFDRLQRFVRYRADLVRALEADPGNSHATSELVRIRHMIKEVHRGVSLNLDAKLLAQRLDAGA